MTLKERLLSLEARMEEKDNEIDNLCDEIMELRSMVVMEEEEDEMTRTSLCDVYGDCEACPDFDVCFDAIAIEEDEEMESEWEDACDDCAQDCDEDCDECRKMMELEEYMDRIRFRGL